MNNNIREIVPEKLGLDEESLKRSLAKHLTFTVGKDKYTATERDWFYSIAHSIRDRLIQRWMQTMRSYYKQDAKRVYYLSLEFLIGRSLNNSLLNMEFEDECRKALEDFGLTLSQIEQLEEDAALGNGGLGRLAACFLDSMATVGYPGYGYGIRYEYGIFTQRIEDGYQVEHPENWLRYGNPWEFPRAEVIYPVKFYGQVVEYKDDEGKLHYHWVDTEDVMAMAYDTPIPGYGSKTVNNMRLWSAKATRDFDLQYFNKGNYIEAVSDKNSSENISRVLYPDDTTRMGKELRLRQQYFFVSASLQDILWRYKKHHDNWDSLPDKVAVQLNDTHPAIAIPELMHLLVDVNHIEWDKAWGITKNVFSYTNHTLLPEALETWDVDTFKALLPRHMQIIYEINHRFLRDVMHLIPGDNALLRRVSLINEEGQKKIRMAHLAIVGSHKVNGVSALHTQLMKDTIFSDFDTLDPSKIINITNGITPRRWLHQANPHLCRLITSHIGNGWLTDLSELKKITELSEDADFRDKFLEAKQSNKVKLAMVIKKKLGISINVNSIYDVQIKRMHEYKRQLLNLMHTIVLYNRIRSQPDDDHVPRTIIFSGKAAPGYYMAKLIIKLINDVADIINNDPMIGDKLKIVLIPNYDVTTATDIIPAADLSEQISTAGMEASGTGNMKLALNGAMTIGTLDGANVEMREEIGEDNIFIFGLTADEINSLKQSSYSPINYYNSNNELKQVLDMISNGFFSPEEPARFKPVVERLLREGDPYYLLADFASYVDCQNQVSTLYKTPQEWARKAILNVANMGKFSSDRTINQYATEIWDTRAIQQEP
jgi:starch phosphorylase